MTSQQGRASRSSAGRVSRCLVIGCLSFLAACVAPKFLIDIPANSTPQREARYYRTQDWQNFAAGAVLDQGLRLVFHGPTAHYPQGVRQIPGTLQTEDFRGPRWWSGEDAPLYRLGIVILAGGIRRQTDRGYRESGWLFNVGGALVTEWANLLYGEIAKHF